MTQDRPFSFQCRGRGCFELPFLLSGCTVLQPDLRRDCCSCSPLSRRKSLESPHFSSVRFSFLFACRFLPLPLSPLQPDTLRNVPQHFPRPSDFLLLLHVVGGVARGGGRSGAAKGFHGLKCGQARSAKQRRLLLRREREKGNQIPPHSSSSSQPCRTAVGR